MFNVEQIVCLDIKKQNDSVKGERDGKTFKVYISVCCLVYSTPTFHFKLIYILVFVEKL